MSISAEDPQTLHVELEEARSRLDGLLREQQAIDDTLEEMATERQRYALVQEACGALEKLSEVGGAELFWGDRSAEVNSGVQIGMARRRVDAFEHRISDIESSRRAVLDRIRREQDTTEYLEDDVYEAQREEELRKLEWVVEREIDSLPDCELVMPWSRGGEDDVRFRKSLAAFLLLSLLLALLVPMIDLPVPESWEVMELPERLTRLIKADIPPPPPLRKELIPEKKQAESPDELVLAEERTPEPSPKSKPKKSAASTGILAFREKFSSLADANPTARLGARARIDRAGEAATGRRGRSLITSQATGSAGIDLASLSRDAVGGGGGQMEGVEVGTATSSIGGIAGPERPLSGGPGPGRTDEEIQIVFDRHKATLYRLYNRELRRDPTLQGQIVLRITIEPDGSVSLCDVQSSDMDAPKLSSQVVSRVTKFDFGAKEGIGAITFLYPIDFLPAT